MNNISLSQQAFLKNHKQQYYIIIFSRILLFFSFLIIWELSSYFDIIDAFIFSSPSRIWNTFYSMVLNKSIFAHLGMTLAETILSFFLVFFLSLLLAILLWLSTTLTKILDPYLVVLNSLPKSALAPLFIVWLGANMKTIIVAGMSVAIFGSIMTLHTAFSNVDSEKVKLIQTLGGRKLHTLFKVILPSCIPIFINTMKVNIGLCLVGVVIGEFIGSKQGLGYLIIYGSQVFQLDLVLMSIVLLCIIAMTLYQGIQYLERIVEKHF